MTPTPPLPAPPTHPLPDAPTPPSKPKRVRITPARIARIHAAVVAADKAIDRLIGSLDDVLVDRERGDSHLVTGLFAVRDHAAEGEIAAAVSKTAAIQQEFAAFA